MRIQEVQNFATAAFNKCCKPRKANENTPKNNSLERSPMADTVSFGQFGGRYAELTKDYAWMRLLSNIDAYDRLNKTIYLSVEPTEETLENPSLGIYKAELVSYRTFRPEDTEENIKQIDGIMQGRVEDFNKLYGYKSGWEKRLTTTEDFIKAARLARYLDNNGLFPSYTEGEDDWMKNRPFTLDY